MCLFVKETSDIKFVNGVKVFYKVLNNPKNSTELLSPYIHQVYIPGWNYAEGNPGQHYSDYYDSFIITSGCIHVFKTLKAARVLGCANSYRIVKVKCYKKDLISDGENDEAGFRKVWLSKATYLAALNSKSVYVRA